MFDSDSEFMKGFETGVLNRSQGQPLEDFGCRVADPVTNDQYEKILAVVRQGLESVSDVAPMLSGEGIDNAVKMLK